MSRSAQLLPPQPPQPRSLWPTDAPLPTAAGASGDALTQPRIALPWAAGGPDAPSTGHWHDDPAAAAHKERSAAGRRALVPLDAAALPYRLDAHMSLAVALDVLATQLHQLRPQEAVLSDLTDALLALRQARSGGEGLAGDEALGVGHELRRVALGPIGEARAALAVPLAACAQALGQAPTTADGIARACTQMVSAAQEVVLRARLALAAKEAQDAQSRPGSR